MLVAAREGRGTAVAIVGEAGVGKTRLVTEAARIANDLGVQTLTARCSELERRHSFGAVRQLFEPLLVREPAASRDRLLEGAAALARPVFDLVESGGGAEADDPSFAVLHGLYWLVASLAARQPLALLVDDAHWADTGSRRWLDYLARRTGDLPLLLVLAARPEEPSEHEVLGAIVRSPDVIVVPPLSHAGSSRLVRLRWPDADDAFCDACHDATRGNPFFVGALLNELTREHLEPRAENADRVRELGPDSVSRALAARLARLPPAAEQVAAATSVLSIEAEVPAVARLTGLDEREVAQAADALAGAGILNRGRRLEFVHPIVRRSVYAQLLPSERARLHALAARSLLDSDGPVEAVAAHLVDARPAGASWAVNALVRAAERAIRRGAPDAAVTYLRRAEAEPPDPEERPAVLSALGRTELLAGELVPSSDTDVESPAVEHLQQALDLTGGLHERAEAALLLGDALWARDRFREAVAVFAAAVAEVRGRDRELELRLEGHVAAAARLDVSAWPLVAGRLDRFLDVEGRTPAERLVAGVLAMDRAIAGEPPDVVADLAERAVCEGRLPSHGGAHVAVYPANALLWSERLERADELLERLEVDARAHGSVRSVSIASCWRSSIAYRMGNLRRAEAEARTSLEVAAARGWGGMPATWAFLVDALRAQGDLAAASEALERSGLGDAVTDYAAWSFFLHSRGLLRLALGDVDSAAADLTACGRHLERWGARTPSIVAWRSSLAEALDTLGEREDALKLAGDEVAAARVVGTARPLGVALSAQGRLTGGEEGIRLLREAVTTLERSPARLELSRALYDLGRALLAGRRREAAREPLRRSMLLAHSCGAIPLLERARHELVSAGWRAEPLRASRFDTLTATERRAVELVARGLSDREIAQALFVSERTVAKSVQEAMRKLRATSRGELADRSRGREPSPVGPGEPYPAGLTARETEVLRLVARGLSNPEVAAELVLSPRTVHAHLRSVYRKLGVHSRAAAARSAAELGLD